MRKSKKKPHKPKSEDTNQDKLYLLHMDLCGPMRVTSVNGKSTSSSLSMITLGLHGVDNPAPEVIIPIAKVVAPEPNASTDSPSSTTVDQDAPSPSSSQTTPETQTHVISNNVEKDNHDLDVAHMHNDPFSGSSSNMRQTHNPFESVCRWTKDHPIANVIGYPSRSVSTRKQLQTDAMWCFFDAFLTSVEPKNFKQ
nr:putative ribonuclease H-like domain-containing protein [Tanacetum cinerariifolium]